MKHLFGAFMVLLFMGTFAHAGLIQPHDLGSAGVSYSVASPALDTISPVVLVQTDNVILVLSDDARSLGETLPTVKSLAIFSRTDFMVIQVGAKSGDGRSAYLT